MQNRLRSVMPHSSGCSLAMQVIVCGFRQTAGGARRACRQCRVVFSVSLDKRYTTLHRGNCRMKSGMSATLQMCWDSAKYAMLCMNISHWQVCMMSDKLTDIKEQSFNDIFNLVEYIL